MNEELKKKIKKIYDYKNKVDFDPLGKDYVQYKPSIREIDRECIEYIKLKIDDVELKRLVLYLKKEEIKNRIKEYEYGIEKELNKLKILKKENLENDKYINQKKKIKNWSEEVNRTIKELENFYKEINQENIYNFIIKEYNENIKDYKLTENITKVFNQEDYLCVIF